MGTSNSASEGITGGAALCQTCVQVVNQGERLDHIGTLCEDSPERLDHIGTHCEDGPAANFVSDIADAEVSCMQDNVCEGVEVSCMQDNVCEGVEVSCMQDLG